VRYSDSQDLVMLIDVRAIQHAGDVPTTPASKNLLTTWRVACVTCDGPVRELAVAERTAGGRRRRMGNMCATWLRWTGCR
jgi:hypothetical protein